MKVFQKLFTAQALALLSTERLSVSSKVAWLESMSQTLFFNTISCDTPPSCFLSWAQALITCPTYQSCLTLRCTKKTRFIPFYSEDIGLSENK